MGVELASVTTPVRARADAIYEPGAVTSGWWVASPTLE
jgi:hypothetical protein